MFGLLKDKLSGFVNKLIKREADKPTPAQAPAPIPSSPPKEEPKTEQRREETKKPEREQEKREEKKKEEKHEEKKKEEKHERKEEKKHEEKKTEHKEEKRHEQKHEDKHEPKQEQKKPEHKEEKKHEAPVRHEEKKHEQSKQEEKKPAAKPEAAVIQTPKQVQPQAKPIIPETKPVLQTKPQESEQKKNILSSIWPFGGKKKEDAVEEHAPKQASTPIQKTIPAAATAPIKSAEPVASAPSKSVAPTGKSAATSAPTKSETAAAKDDLRLDVPGSALGENEMARLEKKALSDAEREMKVKMGLGKSVLGFLSPQVTIEENDVRDLLDDLELALLESDVAMEVSTEVTARLRKKLVGLKVQKGAMQQEVQKQMKGVLSEIMTSTSSFDFIERVAQKSKPVKILFVGPNGAGKTTTMAKIARSLMNAKMSVVFAAGDTFRAAAIEQTEVHAKRLGVPVIKSNYGSDPASVAFDAVNYAKAHKIDVVLIDSAGRQDTNANLLDELKKITRVITPDLKIYIGESIGGHALVEQIRAFHEAIGVDGAILTKLDCDAKGGTAISLTYATGVPILFLGTGQAYEDLKAFDAEWVAGQILT